MEVFSFFWCPKFQECLEHLITHSMFSDLFLTALVSLNVYSVGFLVINHGFTAAIFYLVFFYLFSFQTLNTFLFTLWRRVRGVLFSVVVKAMHFLLQAKFFSAG